MWDKNLKDLNDEIEKLRTEIISLKGDFLELKEALKTDIKSLSEIIGERETFFQKWHDFYNNIAGIVAKIEKFIEEKLPASEQKELYSLIVNFKFLKENFTVLQQKALSIMEEKLLEDYEKYRKGIFDKLDSMLKKYEEFLHTFEEGSSFYFRLRDWNKKVLEIQEDEKRRLSLEIHDGPAQAMANIVMQLEYIKKLYQKSPEQAEAELENLVSFARDILKEIRNYIFTLRPMTLDDFGLVYTVKRFLENLQKVSKGVNFNFKLYGDEDRRFRREVEISLFRIIQEAVNNALKHARAKNINVTLFYSESLIKVSVEDDGIGFDTEKIVLHNKNKESYGFVGMRERAELIGANFKIFSRENEGTKIEVSLKL